MPVDRSLLPPLPGKPDWYVENAPLAIDTAEPRVHAPVRVNAQQRTPEPAPSLLPATSPLAAQAFPTVGTQPSHERRLRKVKALLRK
jgi:hypothetical protein